MLLRVLQVFQDSFWRQIAVCGLDPLSPYPVESLRDKAKAPYASLEKSVLAGRHS